MNTARSSFASGGLVGQWTIDSPGVLTLYGATMVGKRQRAAWLVLVCGLGMAACSSFCAEAAGKPVKLPTQKVQVDPFVHWGMGMRSRMSLLGQMTGGAPQNILVAGVLPSSPADKAGVQMMDQVFAIDGKPVNKIRFHDISEKFRLSAKGTVITLSIGNPLVQGDRREAKLTLVSERLWCPDGTFRLLSFWGLLVEFPEQGQLGRSRLNFSLRVSKEVPRKEHPRWAAKARRGKLENPDEMVPLSYVRRRTARIENGEKDLFIIEREGGWIELLESEELPKSDAVVGRMLRPGAKLILHAPIGYELVDAPGANASTEHPGDPVDETSRAVSDAAETAPATAIPPDVEK